jgi:excisionase family DNA binding protein
MPTSKPGEEPSSRRHAFATSVRLLLTPEEAAVALGIGRTRLFSLVASGELASVCIGRSRRVSFQALEDYVARLTADAEPEPSVLSQPAGRIIDTGPTVREGQGPGVSETAARSRSRRRCPSSSPRPNSTV